MGVGVRRSFTFLLRPTGKQAASLAACLEDHRVLYNAALEHRRTAYRTAGVAVRYGDHSGELKDIRADDAAGQGRWSFSFQQATLRRLDKAFAAFFRRVKAGRTPGFPRFTNMTHSASGTIAQPGRNVAAKSGLNRSILDAGWGVFLRVLAHKAESAGRELIAVDPRNTSRTCSRCGHCAKDNRVTQAPFRCQACGHEAHADVNAAKNILRAGLALRDAAEAA
ncbi:transposase [Microbispora sp. NPDC046933]|uniref:RNA-guided endonuclease InsQ/TnpB family protein n=1 Tax=Microbispora sp. NPDC046933 TaxID=3155618 RepID=UPI0033EC5693